MIRIYPDDSVEIMKLKCRFNDLIIYLTVSTEYRKDVYQAITEIWEKLEAQP